MNDQFKTLNPKTKAIVIVVVGICVFGVILQLLFQQANRQRQSETDPQEVTTFRSPLSSTDEKFAVNYEGSAEPNADAVKQPFVVFNLDGVISPSDARDTIYAVLPGAISQKVVPTYARTYIHVDRKTVKCLSADDCRMSVYIDSPEMYFDFRLYESADGVPAYDIKQIPWKGIAQ